MPWASSGGEPVPHAHFAGNVEKQKEASKNSSGRPSTGPASASTNPTAPDWAGIFVMAWTISATTVRDATV